MPITSVVKNTLVAPIPFDAVTRCWLVAVDPQPTVGTRNTTSSVATTVNDGTGYISVQGASGAMVIVTRVEVDPLTFSPMTT